MKEFFKKPWTLRKILTILGVLAIFGILMLLLLFLLIRFSVIGHIPTTEEIRKISNPISTDIYADNNKLIGKFYVENRGDLGSDDLNDYYKNALVATEDVRFYKHNGVDSKSLARVFFKTILLQKDHSGGGSTILQQIAKNVFPRQRFHFLSLPINKIREMIIANRLAKVYSKEELLLLYSHTVSFGERAFGLHTAARRFFSKNPKDLSLAEAATLVGMLKAPTYYSPRRHPDRAKNRRNLVLGQMLKAGYIDEAAYEKTKQEELVLKYKSLNESIGFARYFQQEVRKEFEAWTKDNPKEDGSLYDARRDGLRIYTTLDYNLQLAAEQYMEEHMKKLQKVFDRSWKTGNLFGTKKKYLIQQLKKTSDYRQLKKQGLSHKEIIADLTEKSKKKIWTWDGVKTDSISVQDSVAHYLKMLHNGILGIHPKNGHVKVWVGGNDYGKFQWDNVRSPRQVGSTFKPIVYYTALKRGAHPCDYYPNELRTYSSYKDWTPRNADGKYGGYMSATEALTHSVNTVSVQMLFRSGLPNVIQQAKEMGITSKLPEVPSIVLGTADISLYEMVNAYAYLANGGRKVTPTCIKKITDRDGNVLYEEERKDIPAVVDSTIIALNSMMSQVTAEGTGRRLYANYDVPFQVMGKTGTTQNQSDGWFISYTGDLVLGAWVGAHDRRIHFRNLGTGSGGRTALPLVANIWEFASDSGYRPSQDITRELAYCMDSISHEEYAMLGMPDDEHRFDKIHRHRDPLDVRIIDILFPDSDIVKNDRPRRDRKVDVKRRKRTDRRRRRTRSNKRSR